MLVGLHVRSSHRSNGGLVRPTVARAFHLRPALLRGIVLLLLLRQSLTRVLCECFFFQAEDGIRDYKVTGVQTCALPIYDALASGVRWLMIDLERATGVPESVLVATTGELRARRGELILVAAKPDVLDGLTRSEERRVGEEGKGRRSAEDGQEDDVSSRDG